MALHDAQEAMTTAALVASVVAAARTGLLAEIVHGPTAPDRLAARCRTDPEGTAAILRVLETQGLIERVEGGVRAAKVLSAAFAGAPPARTIALWESASALVARGERSFPTDGSPLEREAAYTDIVAHLAELFADSAAELAGRLTLPEDARILDVGAGSGVWSLALVARGVARTVTAVDLPAVLAVLESRARAAGLDGRVETVPGDFHEITPRAAAYDVVVLANVLHLEGEAVARALVERFACAVAAGGAFVVVDAFSDGTALGDRRVAAYALHLALRTRGRPYPEGTLRLWLEAAGLPHAERMALGGPGSGQAALVARRRR